MLDQENKPQQVRVKTGETDGTFTESLSGDLKEGDRVIVVGDGEAGRRRPTAAPSSSSSGGPGGGRRRGRVLTAGSGSR